jgi:hypothetical protein
MISKMTQKKPVQNQWMAGRIGGWTAGAIALGLTLMASPIQAQLPNNGRTEEEGDRKPPVSLILENRTRATFIRRFVIKLRRNGPSTDLLANAIGIYPGESRLLVGDYPREFFACVEVVPLVPVNGDSSQVSHVSMGRTEMAGNRARFGIVNEWDSRRFDRGPCP